MALRYYNYVFNIKNVDALYANLEVATSSPPVSGAQNYASSWMYSDMTWQRTFSYLNLNPHTVTCYATAQGSGKDKSSIASATGTG